MEKRETVCLKLSPRLKRRILDHCRDIECSISSFIRKASIRELELEQKKGHR